MSSYYFDNSDQGPPGSAPNPKGDCGNGWVCEHRWSSIAKMVKVNFVRISETVWKVESKKFQLFLSLQTQLLEKNKATGRSRTAAWVSAVDQRAFLQWEI